MSLDSVSPVEIVVVKLIPLHECVQKVNIPL